MIWNVSFCGGRKCSFRHRSYLKNRENTLWKLYNHSQWFAEYNTGRKSPLMVQISIKSRADCTFLNSCWFTVVTMSNQGRHLIPWKWIQGWIKGQIGPYQKCMEKWKFLNWTKQVAKFQTLTSTRHMNASIPVLPESCAEEQWSE